MKQKVIIAMTTCPEASAASLAGALVGERLAACVNQVPGLMSTYVWQGSVVSDRETLLVIKTTHDRLEALDARIRALHPYELPELVALATEGGSESYLEWVRHCTHDTHET